MELITDKVKRLLEDYKGLRDNDNYLIATIWANDLKRLGISKSETLYAMRDGKLTSCESITRSRRKVQEEFPHLRGKTYVARQAEQENVKGQLRLISDDAFDEFWELYDKKVGKKDKIRVKWNKLSDKTKAQIMEYVPMYKKAEPRKQFRKNPETFLNNESWNDELIFNDEPKEGFLDTWSRSYYEELKDREKQKEYVRMLRENGFTNATDGQGRFMMEKQR